jgi:hypothetical protein
MNSVAPAGRRRHQPTGAIFSIQFSDLGESVFLQTSEDEKRSMPVEEHRAPGSPFLDYNHAVLERFVLAVVGVIVPVAPDALFVQVGGMEPGAHVFPLLKMPAVIFFLELPRTRFTVIFRPAR